MFDPKELLFRKVLYFSIIIIIDNNVFSISWFALILGGGGALPLCFSPWMVQELLSKLSKGLSAGFCRIPTR